LRLGSGDVALAYEEALVGMRVGGRREVIVPSHLLFRTGTIDYVVDLLRIGPAPKANRGGG
jgi:FKBP-type peptidyl-prolyl isomerase-like protein